MPAAPIWRAATPSGRRFYWGTMVLALAVGGLQMFHVRGGVLTNYGADLFGTAWLYAMTRLGVTVVQRGRVASVATSAVVIFGLCSASKLGQRVGLVPGRYDPYDILTFALAIAGCIGMERALGPFVYAPPSSAT